MKKISLIILLLALFYLSVSGERKFGIWNPNAPSPFKIPPTLSSLLKNYRAQWIQLTDLEFSGLHWNQGIVVYINKNHKVFANNYISSLKHAEGLDAEDEGCNKDDEKKCESPFLSYETGTVVLKENYLLENGVPQQPSTVTLMIKRQPGYDPSAGDWQYIQFDAAGRILADGNSKNSATSIICAECHHNMVDRDYIFSTFYRPQKNTRIPPKKGN